MFAVVQFLFSLVAVVAAIIISTLFYQRYTDEQTKQNADIVATSKSISEESNQRMAEVKYVVDEVNQVNADIHKSIRDKETRIQSVEAKATNNVSAWDKFFAWTTQEQSASGTSVLNALPAGTVDLQLLKHVTAINGMTILDVDNAANSAKSFKVCSPASSTGTRNCVEIPDSNGDTVLKPLVNSRSVVLQGDTQLKGLTTANNVLKFKAATGEDVATIQALAADQLSLNISPASGASLVVNMPSASGGIATPLKILPDGTVQVARLQIVVPNEPTKTALITLDNDTGIVVQNGTNTSGRAKILNGAVTAMA